MALYLRQTVSRLSVINPLLLNSQRSISSSTIIERQMHQKDSKLVRHQPCLLLQNNNKEAQSNFISNGSIARYSQRNQSSSDGASEEKLTYIYENLKMHVPQFFVAPLDYSVYHKEIVFENRIRGKTYNGIVDYVKQMSYLRVYGHFKYSYVKMDVLKITKHPEDSSVKIRWRISGITGYQILFKMIQFRVWQPKKMIEKHQVPWIDGFSTFYVNSDGLIVRHIADKVMPDEDKSPDVIENVVNKLGNMPKLALFVKLSIDFTPVVI